jgi:hypothetical protein
MKTIVSCILLSTALVGFAQQSPPNVTDRERQRTEGTYFQKQTGNLASSETSKEEQEAASDFGPLVKISKPRYFTFSNDASVEWDSNAQLASSQAQDSAILIERLGLKYSREIAPQWRFSSTVRQQFFWFPSIPQNDFLGQSLDADLSYQIKGLPRPFELVLDPRMFIGGNLYRYEDYNTGSQLIKGAVIRGGADHAVAFFEGKSALFYGYAGSYEATSPFNFDKHQHQFFGGFNQTVIPKYLSAQTFYRFAYSEYTSIDRQDKNNLLGFSLNYRVNEWVGLSGFVNYMRNDSNVADYQNLATGVLCNFMYRF